MSLPLNASWLNPALQQGGFLNQDVCKAALNQFATYTQQINSVYTIVAIGVVLMATIFVAMCFLVIKKEVKKEQEGEGGSPPFKSGASAIFKSSEPKIQMMEGEKRV